jgi:homogentisate 1,2-dioxygenase
MAYSRRPVDACHTDAVSSPEGDGLGSLPDLLTRAKSRRILLITGESQRHVDRVRSLLAGFEVEVYPGARRHVPEAVLGEARQKLDVFGADAVVALGGGSAIGLGKALRLERDLYFVAIPTTYSGSEMTSLYGITAGHSKTTGRNPRVRPDTVIHDVELTLGMPKALTMTSLMNALAHPIGALGTGSLTGPARAQALDAIGILYAAIEALVRAPDDRRARAGALRGAALAAGSLEAGTPGLHHKLAHRLGGRFDLDHSGLHSVLLPHSIHRLRAEAPDIVAEIAHGLRVPDLEAGLFDFLVRAGAGVSLRALGVTFEGLRTLLAEAASSDLPADLLRAAFHGRRPSASTRFEDWGLPELVSVSGPRLEDARRVVVCVHGRGAAADGILGRAIEMVGNDPTVCVVAPQAADNVWYSAKYTSPRAEIGPQLVSALEQVATVLRSAIAGSARDRVVLFGFSQGACLAIELLLRESTVQGGRPAALVALSGALIGPPDERPQPGPALAGLPVLLGAQEEDPWNTRARIEETAALLAGAGCAVTVEMLPGNAHALHGRHRILARQLLSGRAAPASSGGYGNTHESEALPGALPHDRNSPRHGAYGLYAEQVSGTGFVAPRQGNRRTWVYRIRPAAQQGSFVPTAHPTLKSDFATEPPEPNLVGWGPLPFPAAGTPTDFVDGLATVGGAGSPRLRRGFAVHVYAANRGMEERCFSDADGDLLLLPQEGSLTLMTELGVLDLAPGQLAVLPRGLRFSVLLKGATARGYVAEAFGRHFELPERGPVGANGLAEARHFRAPAAWHEDRLALGYRITTKLGGELFEAAQDYSPFDVVAWHGNHCPYVYDLALFSPAGNTRVDHVDPSIHTVLSAPLDEVGTHTLDLVLFPPRWDVTEDTFRPPYFHRNVTTEINGIVRDAATAGSPFVPGGLFLTPSLTPHGVVASSVERFLALDDQHANRPQRSSDASLWFQFESALPFSLSAWARGAGNRIADWHLIWGAYRKHFRVPGAV